MSDTNDTTNAATGKDVSAMQFLMGPPPLAPARNPNSPFEDLVTTVATDVGKTLHDTADLFLSGIQGLGKSLGGMNIMWVGLGIAFGAFLLAAVLITRDGGGGPLPKKTTGPGSIALITPSQAAGEEKQLNADLDKGTKVLEAFGAPSAEIQTRRDIVAFTQVSQIAARTTPSNAGTGGQRLAPTQVVSSFAPSHYASLHGLNMTKYRESLALSPSPQSALDNSAAVHERQVR